LQLNIEVTKWQNAEKAGQPAERVVVRLTKRNPQPKEPSPNGHRSIKSRADGGLAKARNANVKDSDAALRTKMDHR